MAEQRRTKANTAEQWRPLCDQADANDAARDDAAKQRRAAYIELIDALPIRESMRAILRLLVSCDGAAQLTQRGLAKAIRASTSTVNSAVRDLQAAGLVRRADRVFRLDTNQLRGVADAWETRQREAAPPPDQALDVITRSGVFGSVRACSANSRTVNKNNNHPVPRTPYRNGTGAGGEQPNTAERRAAEPAADRDQTAANLSALQRLPEWRALQQHDFRDPADRPLVALRWDKLGAAYYAACDAGVLPEPGDCEEQKRKFKAACLEVAENNAAWAAEHHSRQEIRRPAVVLMRRVAAGTLFRVADKHMEKSKQIEKQHTRQVPASERTVTR